MSIPLPDLLREHRFKGFKQGLEGARSRLGLKVWSYLAQRPSLYHALTSITARTLAGLGKTKGFLSKVPLASGWTSVRELPAPQGKTFQQLWAKRNE